MMSFFVFVILANLFAFVNSQAPFCFNGSYTSNSTYATNLNTLLASLPTNVDQNGFYEASLGQYPDKANAMVLCRGDAQLDTCRNCVGNATADVLRACANYRQATFWSDFCMLRYSNENMLGTMEVGYKGILSNPGNASSPSEFEAELRILFDDLRGQASNGGDVRKVAWGNRNTSDLQIIYALVQCTPDLSPNDCNSCLTAAGRQVPQCCYSSLGVRILMPSCNLHYEVQHFYNDTRLQELEPVALPPAPAPTQPSGSPPNSPRNGDNHTTRTIIIVVVSVAGSTLILGAFLGFLIRKRMTQKLDKETKIDEISNTESLLYDFGMIRSATYDFSEAKKLGQGGFGAVYKGKLPNGQEIAVKRLSINSSQGDVEFKNEVMLLSKLQHRNLVRLLGFSLKGEEKLLIYEYVPNASLDQFLFDPTKRSLMDWDRCYKIIGGIARGILYLHEDSRLRIIHRDLKPSNVLLDEEMNPKIADFGVARLFVVDETQGTSKIAGTRGYMSPEYLLHGLFSVKSDVFSFGVVVLEIITGQKNSYLNEENEKFLLSSAWENWHKGTPTELIDPVLRASSNIQQLLRCIHIALLCIQENAADRPTMASVIIMLNSSSIELPEPSEPIFYFMSSKHVSEASLFQQPNLENESSSKSAKSDAKMT